MKPGTIGCGALVVGSVIAMDPGGWSPFGPSKWLVISTIGFGAGGAVLWSNRTASIDRRTSKIWTALVGLLLVSALVRGDVPTALLGHPTRHFGVLTWLLLWLLFVAGQLLEPTASRFIETASIVAAGGLGGYALWERLFGRPIAIANETARLTGTFGSAAFLGAAACLFAPIAICVALDRGRSTRRRAWAAVAATLAGCALVGSGSRAAWLGMLVAVALAIIIGRQVSPDHEASDHEVKGRRPMVAVLVVVCGVGLIAIAFLPRLGDIVERDHGAASRLDEWRVGWRVLEDHPLLGVGPEGYRIAVSEGIDATYEQEYGRTRTTPDRAHSGPLDVALAGGIVAAGLYVVLVGSVLWRARRAIARGDGFRRGLAIGVTAYAIQQLFLFPLAEIDPVWWMFAGMLVAGEPKPAPARSAASAGLADTADQSRSRIRTLVAPIAMAVSVIALVAGTLDVAADRLAGDALAMSVSGSGDRAVEAAERAVDERPDNVTYRLVAATVHLQRGTLADIDAAVGQARAALDWSPHDPNALDQLGLALSRRAVVTGLDTDAVDAFRLWTDLVRSDPHRVRWQVQLGRAAVLAGDVDAARMAWSAALALDPTSVEIATLLAELDRRDR
ncbi:MAG: O-antigen ligase family protein [Ilumatobacteraceae bacterium]